MKASVNLPVYCFEAALVDPPVKLPNAVPPLGARWVDLCTSQGRYSCLSWTSSDVFAPDLGDVSSGKAWLTESTDVDGHATLLLTRFDLHHNGGSIDLVPDDACPIEGEVAAIRTLVQCIGSKPLRRFVDAALSMSDSFKWFWTCPASLQHHHAFAGGLATHSREVAERAAASLAGNSDQQDFAISYGLLHDFGKVWSYEDGSLTPAARRLGHEQLGFEKLLPGLLRLRQEWEEGGLVMQSLLGGGWRREGSQPTQAVGSVVRSLDQFSAESASTRISKRGQKPWNPRIVRA